MKLFIAEKPSVAGEIAKSLGGSRRLDGYYVCSDDNVVTWAIGHLMQLAEPGDYDARYNNRSLSHLPIIPTQFQFAANPKTRGQLKVIGSLLKDASCVVVATDPGREGEMIAREVLDHFRYKGKTQRLWITSMTPVALKAGLGNLLDGELKLPLYHAALARSKSDWLIGMNFSRAFTSLSNPGGRGPVVSIGRVQTPTLALIVRRDREIADFKASDYFTLSAQVKAACGESVVLRWTPEEKILVRATADQEAARITGFNGPLSVNTEDKKTPPPQPFSLAELQKVANASLGWGAKMTLDIAQALYEKHKATTYPRVEEQHLPESMADQVPEIAGHLIASGLFPALAGSKFSPLIRKQVFDDSKLVEHHAIIPTTVAPNLSAMSADERSGYALIAGRFLAALHPDYEYKLTTILLDTGNSLVLKTSGSVPVKLGWRILFKESSESESTLPNIPDGNPGTVDSVTVESQRTKPPAYYTEGTLLGDMLNVAKFVSDPAHKSLLRRNKGIGTQATRAAIIDTLFRRDFIETFSAKRKKFIQSTPAGRSVITAVETHLPALADVAQTAVWEESLEAIAAGEAKEITFVHQISESIRTNIQTLKSTPAMLGTETTVTCPKSGKPVLEFDEAYQFPGVEGAAFNKKFIGRTMSAEDYASVLASSEPVPFDGFISKAGKPFSAGLSFNPDREYNGRTEPGIELVFNNNNGGGSGSSESTPTDVLCPKSSEPALDRGTYWTFPGFPGLYCNKEFLGREMTLEEYREALASDAGVIFDGFVSKRTGKKYNARVTYDNASGKSKKPGFNLDFS